MPNLVQLSKVYMELESSTIRPHTSLPRTIITSLWIIIVLILAHLSYLCGWISTIAWTALRLWTLNRYTRFNLMQHTGPLAPYIYIDFIVPWSIWIHELLTKHRDWIWFYIFTSYSWQILRVPWKIIWINVEWVISLNDEVHTLQKIKKNPERYRNNIDVTSNDGYVDLVDIGVCAQIKLTSQPTW